MIGNDNPQHKLAQIASTTFYTKSRQQGPTTKDLNRETSQGAKKVSSTSTEPPAKDTGKTPIPTPSKEGSLPSKLDPPEGPPPGLNADLDADAIIGQREQKKGFQQAQDDAINAQSRETDASLGPVKQHGKGKLDRLTSGKEANTPKQDTSIGPDKSPNPPQQKYPPGKKINIGRQPQNPEVPQAEIPKSEPSPSVGLPAVSPPQWKQKDPGQPRFSGPPKIGKPVFKGPKLK